MMEAIGLAGMTETPLVIVDTQRGGPVTGLADEARTIRHERYGIRYAW